MKARIDRLTTGTVAATVEAWHELRIHKLRVLLSLVGVMVAVASLTTALAAAAIAKQVLVEQYEHQGRPAMLAIWAHDPQQGNQPSPDVMRPAFEAATAKLKIEYASMAAYAEARLTHANRQQHAGMQVVDPDFAILHRIVTSRGRWLETADEANMAPAIVVGERTLKKLGLATTPLPFTLELGSSRAVTATVVGAFPSGEFADVFMLPGTYERWFGADRPLTDAQFEMWVPPERAKELIPAVRGVVAAELPGYQVDVHRNDYLAYAEEDPLREVTLVVAAIAGVILLLGALSLLNVALVTIQQRVREVGIRRSFGATTGRVFFSVMMESVVATVVAGAVGVMLAIGLVTNPWVADKLLRGVDDVPPFPLDAAFIGLGVSLAVGALAGVLPALIAARVKIVDAIRF